jgi:Ca2+-binding RTX toxin-like protein
VLKITASFSTDDYIQIYGAQCPAEEKSMAYILGTEQGETHQGTPERDDIVALGGNDTVYANAGNDYVNAGEGNDYVYGEAGDDRLDGQPGNDVLYGGAGNDYVNAGPDSDVVYGEAGNDELDGQSGNDVLYGGADNDTLFGDNGADKLYGEAGNDTLHGGGDKDIDELHGGTGIDNLYGSGGNDSFYFATTDSGDVHYRNYSAPSEADTIHNFTDGDKIYLQGNYSYAGSTDVPSDGQYSVWQKDNDYVVTWNAAGDDGFHDVVVQGSNPTGDILFA